MPAKKTRRATEPAPADAAAPEPAPADAAAPEPAAPEPAAPEATGPNDEVPALAVPADGSAPATGKPRRPVLPDKTQRQYPTSENFGRGRRSSPQSPRSYNRHR